MSYNGLLNENITLMATPSTIVDWSGGDGICIMEGTFNGATMILQTRSNVLGAWVSMGSSAELTEDGVVAFVAGASSQLRILATVANPTGVEVSIQKV
jgi:hypothetical protein